MKKNLSITLITPKAASTKIDHDLVQLTKFLVTKGLVTGTSTYGALGGEYGYGDNFENNVFMLHRFCLCEKKDCPWCFGCFCEMAEVAGKWQVIKECDNCLNPKETMPNFLYKPTNLKIHWYKWIGRDMKFSERPSRKAWKQIMEHCYRSLEDGREDVYKSLVPTA